jgi:hypothetical protein
VIPNTTTPKISLNPSNGTIQPHTQQPINVTVYMPGGKNKPGMVWNAYVSTVAVANTTVVNGATIQAGALKMMTITAAKPKFQVIYVLVAMVACAIVAVGIYQVVSVRRARKAKVKKAPTAMRAAKKVTKRAARKGKKKAVRRKRKAAARRPAARGARRRRRAARRR